MNKLKKEALGKGVNPLIIDAMDSDGYVELYNGNRVSYSRVIVLGDGTFVDCDDSCIVAAVDDGEYYFSEDAQYCDYSGEWYSPEATMYDYYDGFIAESVLGAAEVVWCEYMEMYINKDKAVYCEDVRGFALKEHAYYSPADDCYVYYQENVKKTFCIVEYGEVSDFEDLNDNKSPYSIGFEIEKTDFLGARFIDDYVGEYPLFAGYMLDSSCGVEAVTHILPLSTDYYVRNFVFEMIDGSSDVINSDSDSDCGGHINVSVKGYTPEEVYDKTKTAMGLLYALYRFRLKNTYCNNNKYLDSSNNTKYSPVYLKSNIVEIRLPSRVINKNQLKLRYLLMAEIMEHCFETKDTFSMLLDKVDYILMDMYNDDREKVKNIKVLARHFWRYLLIGKISNKIEKYLVCA